VSDMVTPRSNGLCHLSGGTEGAAVARPRNHPLCKSRDVLVRALGGKSKQQHEAHPTTGKRGVEGGEIE
jgi:hypothetical protein